jgi:coproporphyrinogen III oxidase
VPEAAFDSIESGERCAKAVPDKTHSDTGIAISIHDRNPSKGSPPALSFFMRILRNSKSDDVFYGGLYAIAPSMHSSSDSTHSN